jgi:hypothetical protein
MYNTSEACNGSHLLTPTRVIVHVAEDSVSEFVTSEPGNIIPYDYTWVGCNRVSIFNDGFLA